MSPLSPLLWMERRRTLAAQSWQATSLNIATSLRHAACLTTGGHEPSGTRVKRPVDGHTLGYLAFDVCARCEVPYAGKSYLGFNNKLRTTE